MQQHEDWSNCFAHASPLPFYNMVLQGSDIAQLFGLLDLSTSKCAILNSRCLLCAKWSLFLSVIMYCNAEIKVPCAENPELTIILLVM